MKISTKKLVSIGMAAFISVSMIYSSQLSVLAEEAAETLDVAASVPSSTGPKSDLEATAYTGISLNRSTPEENGISSEYILNLLDTIEEKNFGVHAIMMAVGEDVIYEAYYEPYDPGDIVQMNSLSKMITNTAIGIAVDQGLMDLDDYVKDVLADYVTVESDNLDKLQLKHLLTMTGGRSAVIDDYSDLDSSWAEYILAQEFNREPGANFLYDSSCTILSSTMLLEATGKNTEDYLKDNGFFEDLGFGNYFMAATPDGANNGAGGFKMTPEDLLKTGMLYLHGGVFQDKQVLSGDWVNKSLGYELVVTGQEQEQIGYKFHWYNKGAGYMYALGAGGQTILICPELDLTILIVGQINGIVQDTLAEVIIEPTLADGEDRTYDGARYQELLDRTEKLTFLDDAAETTSTLADAVNGRTYVAEEGSEIGKIRIDITDGQIDLALTDADGVHTISGGVGSYYEGTCEYVLHNNQYIGESVISSAAWKDDQTLELRMYYPNSMYIDVITLVFSEDASSVQMYRCDSKNYSTSGYDVITFVE